MKRFTTKYRFKNYNNGEDTPTIKHLSDNTVKIRVVYDDPDNVIDPYVVGTAIDRLYEYEELGHTPEKLRHIIQMYHVYRSQAYSTYGSLGSNTPNPPPPFYRDIHDIIDVAMKKRDRSVSLFFGSQGISVDVIPYPPIEEDSDD